MGLLKFVGKTIGSAALVVTGTASAIVRQAVYAAGNDELGDAIGKLEDKSFDTIRDMWTPDEKKDEDYYERQVERRADRTESAIRSGEAQRREYERMKALKEKNNNNN